MATKVWATTTPAVVNGSVNPNHWSRYWPDQAASSERVEQGDAGDDRGQHHRQRAQGAHQAPAGERHPGQQPGQRHAEHEGGEGGPQ